MIWAVSKTCEFGLLGSLARFPAVDGPTTRPPRFTVQAALWGSFCGRPPKM
jgi:hypothetical protein